MATLRIALQDGFEDDTVVIAVNGKEVFNQKNVKTKRQIGKAAGFELKLEPGPADVEVSLPLRQLSDPIALKVSDDVYLGISVVDGRIVHRISSEPFRYA
ncbi:MAG TPA: hypothetical protein VNO50_07280 [Pyrinomonadaceae bacterium]|nr:hypothetical protein [Pyrinomonadaceae bacterium]